MIHHEYKFIFLHIPKCGGSSVERLFNAWQNKEHRLVGKHDSQHYYLRQILKKVPIAKDYYKFTFVRNPFSRIVSEYHYMMKESSNHPQRIKNRKIHKLPTTFKEFCKNITNLYKYCYPYHDTTLIDYVMDKNGKQLVDYIGRFENLQQDFNIICDKIGITRQKLPHRNKTKRKHYTEYYDDQTREIVAKKYAKDIEYFGYEFGE